MREGGRAARGLAAAAGLGVALAAGAASAQPVVWRDVEVAVAQQGRAPVVIALVVPAGDASALRQAGEAERLADAVLHDLAPGELVVRRLYRHVPALAGTLDAAGLARLARDPRVAVIHPELPLHTALAEAVPSIGALDVRQRFGLTGRGVRVAIIDTGIDETHPDLAGAIVGQHCFSPGWCPPDGTTSGDSAADDDGHGTMVAGVVTADGVVAGPGFAPGADIVPIRVFGAPEGTADWSDLLAALDWIVDQQAALDIRVVNMSLVSPAFTAGACDAAIPELAAVVAQLNDLGVIVFAASGNEGGGGGLGSPACISAIVAVGATYDADLGREPDWGSYAWMGDARADCYDVTTGPYVATCFTDTGAMLDLFAPGASICTTYLGGTSHCSLGTSFASPAAAGVAALLLECDPALGPADVERLLEETGRPVADPHDWTRSFPGIDAWAAAAACMANQCVGRADGTACNDGSACTADDRCRAGECVGESAVECPAATGCREEGVCDPRTGTCSNAARTWGTPCDDGDPCTTDDVCQHGVCVAGDPVTCRAADDCHRAGACDPATGACTTPAQPDGHACDGGSCAAGACTPPASSGCGCRAAGSGDPPATLLVLASVLVATQRRRAARRRAAATNASNSARCGG